MERQKMFDEKNDEIVSCSRVEYCPGVLFQSDGGWWGGCLSGQAGEWVRRVPGEQSDKKQKSATLDQREIFRIK